VHQDVKTDDWTTPGAFEVAPSVFRIPLPLPNDGLKTVNVYALVGADGLVVVDTGWAVDEGRDALAAGLARLGLGLADITRFLVTHVHRDHYTLGVQLRSEFGMTVSLGEGERATLTAATDPSHVDMALHVGYMRRLGAADLAEQLSADAEFDEQQLWELPDDWLGGGDVVQVNGRALDVIATPGHTHGHVVFHDAGGALLFAGDHVLPTITPSVGFEGVLHPNPLGDYLDSLALVRRRDDATLLPAHGPVGPSVHERVDELLHHHGIRLRQTAAAVSAGASTAHEVAGQLRWTRHERALSDLNTFNQMLAVAETNAHLLLLEAQGVVSTAVEDGIEHYESR
jgi:glyoxylase-like metal-dependent hydrolase (beta-lactamase superfamily II)